ncbi:MAG: hypothetical protein IPO00_12495 [Betaproteobacteria bacterium]|nr:hypothetical protein [Betaproteobacteria bacterium]
MGGVSVTCPTILARTGRLGLILVATGGVPVASPAILAGTGRLALFLVTTGRVGIPTLATAPDFSLILVATKRRLDAFGGCSIGSGFVQLDLRQQDALAKIDRVGRKRLLSRCSGFHGSGCSGEGQKTGGDENLAHGENSEQKCGNAGQRAGTEIITHREYLQHSPTVGTVNA